MTHTSPKAPLFSRIAFLILCLTAFFLALNNHQLGPLLAGAVIGLVGAGLFRIGHKRGESEILRRWKIRHGVDPLFSDLTGSAEKTDEPVPGLLEGLAAKVRESADQKTENPEPAEKTSSKSLSLEIENLTREQENLEASFRELQNSIRVWTEEIDKAGRISQSILRVSGGIVLDSRKAAQGTDAAAKTATDGIREIGREIRTMTDLKANLGSSAEVIRELVLASDQIGDFLSSITTLARKTNLLALNAGIEAARAGDQGKGFAVVAGEIKTLAEASTKASGDVKTLVDEIRKKTSNAVSLITNTEKFEENVDVVYNAGDVFLSIVKSVREAGSLLEQISKALRDQNADNELLLELIRKLHSSGDIAEKMDRARKNMEELQRISGNLRAEADNLEK